MIKADWIAVDWGTTHLRAWAMQGQRSVTSAQSDAGMNALPKEGFEPALLDLIDPWLDPARKMDVMCCGMVGARQGWAEAPYRSVPCTPTGPGIVTAKTLSDQIRVHILPGLNQIEPADVMRGEETQIAGFLRLNEGWDGVICLPGTHTKWAHVSAGEVISFQTFLTGELFALLSEHSVLRHSVAPQGWDQDAFLEALGDMQSKPEMLAARLFRLRADDLINATDQSITRARLSGLLIGAELSAAKPYWLGQQVAVIGADAMATAYVAALSHQGIPATHAKSDAMTLAGLASAHRTLELSL